VTEKSETSSSRSLPLDLNALLAPMSSDEFFASYCSKLFCHVPGAADKFAALLPWQELNRILELHTLRPSQFELVKSGTPVDPRSYTEYMTREGWVVPRVKVKEFTSQLREGATLILSHIHEMYPPLMVLAESLERRFRAPSGINVYAAWREAHGFGIHRDKHDVFIAQVFGKKRWRLYGTTPGRVSRPPQEHVWENILNAGDLLYIPRGCWHAAVPLNEASLHLSISVENPTISDVLTWAANEFRAHELGEVNVSVMTNPADHAELLEKTRQAFLSTLDSNLIDRYFESSDLRRLTMPRFSLPWSATPESLPVDGRTLVRLRSHRTVKLRLDSTNHFFEFSLQNQTWRFPVMMKVFLEALKDGQTISVDELIALGRNTPGETMSRAFIATLVKEGILTEVRSS
jgi:ribosomal protein L16 Arg81 hydroxylase